MEKAHEISNLVMYGEIMCHEETHEPVLWIFPCDSITEYCVAVPFKVSNTIINAKKWLVLKSKDNWYTIFFNYLQEKANE